MPRPHGWPRRLRSPRPWFGSALGGSLALLLASALARSIEAAAAAHQAAGRLQLAADGRSMLWSPVLMALLAVLALVHALVQLLRPAALHGRRRSPRIGRPAPGPLPYRSPLQPLPAVDRRLAQAWRLLDLEPGSPWSAVRASWRRRLRHWHPDAGGDPQLWHARLEAYRLLRASDLRR